MGILMPPPRGSGEKTTTTLTTTTTSRKRRRRRKEESEINDGKIIIGHQHQRRRHKWRSLEAGKDDLSLDRTLPTGQSFRWQKVEEYDENDENEKKYSTYVGVIGRRVVQIRERMEFEEEEEKS